ncbi:hypothetical protein L596_027160 [Steinernema carpocapsae]|uniref:Uncharacterized protein n=1 Tax=Steinernema carpocapsae TaxID=34508 RepID=A0A4U5M3K5_STECR|nr:hypothetical protein L596_027160 [Steinernema carpocapsae]
MLLPGLLLSTLLLTFATATNVTLGSENYPYCDMSRFKDTFFHTVTCDGYVRVKMEDYDSFESMNKQIDKILGARQADELCDVRAFYHNETHWIFFRMSDRKSMRYARTDRARTLEFWIGDLQEKEEFVSFPANESWTSMGLSYSSYTQYAETFYSGLNSSLPTSTVRFCEPHDWFYDFKEKRLGALLMSVPERWVSIFARKNVIQNTSDKKIGFYFNLCLSQQLDPIAYKYHDYRKVDCTKNDDSRGNYTQIYRATGDDVYSKMLIPNAKEADEFFSNESSTYPAQNGEHCWLRKFRLDLGEEPYAFMLPKIEGLPLVGPKLETSTTSTLPTTLTSTGTTESWDEDDDDDYEEEDDFDDDDDVFEEPFECEAGMDNDECEYD